MKSDRDKSFHYYKLAAKDSSLMGMYRIGKALLRGDDRIKRNIEEGFHYLCLCASEDDDFDEYKNKAADFFQRIENDGI